MQWNVWKQKTWVWPESLEKGIVDEIRKLTVKSPRGLFDLVPTLPSRELKSLRGRESSEYVNRLKDTLVKSESQA